MTLGRRNRFEALTLRYLGHLLRTAARYSESEAEDYVQETFLRAWVAFDQLRDPAAVYSWLLRILCSVVFERQRGHLRRQKRVWITGLTEELQDRVASEEPRALDLLLARAERGRLRNALQSIPERFAQAVVLHDVRDLTYREIAEVTGSAIGTVMSRISRGRRMLAEALALPVQEEASPLALDEGLRATG